MMNNFTGTDEQETATLPANTGLREKLLVKERCA
jgi:hypothetical protein